MALKMILFIILPILCIIFGSVVIKKLASIKTCSECGKKITNKNANQCPKCGNPIR